MYSARTTWIFWRDDRWRRDGRRGEIVDLMEPTEPAKK
jgi:hypothetical protein